MSMIDPDTALAALWARDEPPARDPAFVRATLARVGRRRLIHELLDYAALGVPALAILWAAWPSLAGLVPQAIRLLSVSGPGLVCVAAIALVLWSTEEALRRAP